MGVFDDLMPPPTLAPAQAAAPTQANRINFDDLMPPAPDQKIIPAGMGQPGLSWNPLEGLWPPSLPAAPTQPWKGGVLPISGDGKGNVSFDSDAGVLGSLKGAVDYMHNAATGQVDPTSPEGVAASAKAALAVGALGAPAAALPAKAGVTAIPTADALHAAGSNAYKAFDSLPILASQQHVADLANGVQQELYGRGMLPIADSAPGTHATLRMLQDAPKLAPGESVAGVPYSALSAARQSFGHLSVNAKATNTDQEAAALAKAAIDKFIYNPPEGSIVAGGDLVPQAGALLREANSNWGAGARSDQLNGIERAASLRTAGNNSGANIGNATRQRVASLLLKEGATAGFVPDEIAALEGVNQGSTTSNLLRNAANKFGGGGGLGSTVATAFGTGLGFHLAGEGGALAGGAMAHSIGPVLKSAQNSLDTGALKAVDKTVRQRSQLFEDAQANSPLVQQFTESRDALPQTLGSVLSPGALNSVNNADPNSRAANLAGVLAATRPQPPQPQGGGLGAIFMNTYPNGT